MHSRHSRKEQFPLRDRIMKARNSRNSSTDVQTKQNKRYVVKRISGALHSNFASPLRTGILPFWQNVSSARCVFERASVFRLWVLCCRSVTNLLHSKPAREKQRCIDKSQKSLLLCFEGVCHPINRSLFRCFPRGRAESSRNSN